MTFEVEWTNDDLLDLEFYKADITCIIFLCPNANIENHSRNRWPTSERINKIFELVSKLPKLEKINARFLNYPFFDILQYLTFITKILKKSTLKYINFAIGRDEQAALNKNPKIANELVAAMAISAINTVSVYFETSIHSIKGNYCFCSLLTSIADNDNIKSFFFKIDDFFEFVATYYDYQSMIICLSELLQQKTFFSIIGEERVIHRMSEFIVLDGNSLNNKKIAPSSKLETFEYAIPNETMSPWTLEYFANVINISPNLRCINFNSFVQNIIPVPNATEKFLCTIMKHEFDSITFPTFPEFKIWQELIVIFLEHHNVTQRICVNFYSSFVHSHDATLLPGIKFEAFIEPVFKWLKNKYTKIETLTSIIEYWCDIFKNPFDIAYMIKEYIELQPITIQIGGHQTKLGYQALEAKIPIYYQQYAKYFHWACLNKIVFYCNSIPIISQNKLKLSKKFLEKKL